MGRPASRGHTPKPIDRQPHPQPQPQVHHQTSKKSKGPRSYKSDGVEDNDVFLLPVSDYQIMAVLTALATLVRLFRIYQPTSVVFDEVQ